MFDFGLNLGLDFSIKLDSNWWLILAHIWLDHVPVLAGHQKVMRFPGKRHSLPLVIRYFCPRPAFKKVWPYITVWKSWLQFDCRFVSTFAGMQMLHTATQVQRIKLHIERWSKKQILLFLGTFLVVIYVSKKLRFLHFHKNFCHQCCILNLCLYGRRGRVF